MLCFLKLGGSLITNKSRVHTPRLDLIQRIAGEISEARQLQPDLQIILGHGSGSFGHVPAQIYGTRDGVTNQRQWEGFVEVWKEARALNLIIVDDLLKNNLPVISFPPSSMVLTENKKIIQWAIEPMIHALSNGLIPIIYGDVVFDQKIGGTILSTEDLFDYLTPLLKPQHIFIAGIELGVWSDFPNRKKLVKEITRKNYTSLFGKVNGSLSTDVTGGMKEKVRLMMKLCEKNSALDVMIFSGEEPGAIKDTLLGKVKGTLIQTG